MNNADCDERCARCKKLFTAKFVSFARCACKKCYPNYTLWVKSKGKCVLCGEATPDWTATKRGKCKSCSDAKIKKPNCTVCGVKLRAPTIKAICPICVDFIKKPQTLRVITKKDSIKCRRLLTRWNNGWFDGIDAFITADFYMTIFGRDNLNGLDQYDEADQIKSMLISLSKCLEWKVTN